MTAKKKGKKTANERPVDKSFLNRDANKKEKKKKKGLEMAMQQAYITIKEFKA